MLLGPKIRLTYIDRFVPTLHNRALLVGVVNDDEYNLLTEKGYNVTKADLFPRNPSILKLDLTAPEAELHGQFALLVASDVLEHIPDDRAAIKGIYDLLMPGGLAYIHVPGGDINAPLDDNDRKHGHARHGYNEEQIKAVVESQPFQSIQYHRTFNQIETTAYKLALEGDDEGGLKMLETSPFDGESGRCHMFVLTK